MQIDHFHKLLEFASLNQTAPKCECRVHKLVMCCDANLAQFRLSPPYSRRDHSTYTDGPDE